MGSWEVDGVVRDVLGVRPAAPLALRVRVGEVDEEGRQALLSLVSARMTRGSKVGRTCERADALPPIDEDRVNDRAVDRVGDEIGRAHV